MIVTFGEPAVDRGEKVAGFGAATLIAAEPGKAHSGAQFPELGLLFRGDAQGFGRRPLSPQRASAPWDLLAAAG